MRCFSTSVRKAPMLECVAMAYHPPASAPNAVPITFMAGELDIEQSARAERCPTVKRD